MKQEIKQTFDILCRHIIIGCLITFLLFWLFNEIPNENYLLARLHVWITILSGLTLTIWLSSRFIYKQVKTKSRNLFLVAFGFIFFIWTIAFLLTALSEGVLATIKSKQFQIFDSLEGYVIYQLWVYWSFAIIHSLTGGLFLAIDLKKLNR